MDLLLIEHMPCAKVMGPLHGLRPTPSTAQPSILHKHKGDYKEAFMAGCVLLELPMG